LLNEGRDVSIFATGHLVWKAIEAGHKLAEMGISAEIINIHTIKPLDEEAILASVAKTKCAVSAEEHQMNGGLGDSIAQLLAPRSGRVLFRGENLTKLLPQQLASKGVVLIPEGRQIFTQLSVLDNLRLGAFGRQDPHIRTDIDTMLDRFPALKPLRDRQAGLLSGGEQQMLAIARGLMAKPQVLLLDEPSLGLAPQLVVSLYETLGSLCEEGISILLVDQMAQLAFSVAHRLYILETGKITQTGTPDKIKYTF
ncbi:MAG: hypothetical protein RLZZ69_1921, partial [Cyanobacteriota bacterium]